MSTREEIPVSVIVPAYNAAQTIGPCIDALRAQDVASAYEIIVVDDCSTDETASLAAAAGVTLIKHDEQRGAGASRNSGVARARGKIICFTDADCAPRSDWLRQLLPAFDDPQVRGCKGAYVTQQEEIVARFVQLEYEDKYDLLARQETIDFIDTYSAAYDKAVLELNNGFDERFTYLEDQELSFRLAAQGYALVFQADALVSHYHSDSLSAYCRKKFTIGYWKAQIVRRFPERAVRDSHTPQVMKLQMLLAALLPAAAVGILITPWSALLLALVLGLFLISTLPFLRKAWRKDKAVALAAPFLLLARAVALGLGYAWGLARPARAGLAAHAAGQEDQEARQ